jgi:hypothetical protein
MFKLRTAIVLTIVSLGVTCFAQNSRPMDRPQSLVLILKGGHEKSFPLADVSRIEFNPIRVVLKNGHQESFSDGEILHIEMSNNSTAGVLGLNHFVGRWKVGTGVGSHFFISLERDGQARKTMGASHGTWELVNGEARISWDDGWHDAIRKVGDKHEKFAYEPSKSFDDKPSNVTDARNTNPQPI